MHPQLANQPDSPANLDDFASGAAARVADLWEKQTGQTLPTNALSDLTLAIWEAMPASDD